MPDMSNLCWIDEAIVIPGLPKKLYNTEIGFQFYTAYWLRKQYEITGDRKYKRWHHSANEREGGKAGFFAKMMGQSKGFPDWVNLSLRVAIELKILGGTLSTEQAEWLLFLKEEGWETQVIYHFDDFTDYVIALT